MSETKPYTTLELSSTFDSINQGFIIIQKFMEFMKGDLEEESQKYIDELMNDLNGSIEEINEVV